MRATLTSKHFAMFGPPPSFQYKYLFLVTSRRMSLCPTKIFMPNEESTINQFYEGLKIRRFHFHWQQNRGISADTDFYDWHNRNQFSTLEAKLSTDSVRVYEPLAENTSKRRRRELVDTLNEIAKWVDEQNERMRAALPNIPSAWIDEL